MSIWKHVFIYVTLNKKQFISIALISFKVIVILTGTECNVKFENLRRLFCFMNISILTFTLEQLYGSLSFDLIYLFSFFGFRILILWLILWRRDIFLISNKVLYDRCDVILLSVKNNLKNTQKYKFFENQANWSFFSDYYLVH